MAREICDAEEQVTQLVFDSVPIGCPHGVAQLLQLLGDLVEHPAGIRPVESASRGTALKLHGPREGRQRDGDAVHHAASAFGPFGRLHLLPLPRLLRRVHFVCVAEYVRVAPNHLAGNRVDDVLEAELTGFASHLRVEHDLEEQIAELVHEVGEILPLDRVRDLVGLLDRVRGDGAKRLHAIPRAAALGIAQAGHDADQVFDPAHEQVRKRDCRT